MSMYCSKLTNENQLSEKKYYTAFRAKESKINRQRCIQL